MAILREEVAIVATKHFKVGDHVSWNSEAGRVSGTISKVITSEIEFKGYKVHASKDEPPYEIKSDKTDHIAMHEGSALTRLSGGGRATAWNRSSTSAAPARDRGASDTPGPRS